jgi:hypothetical protein
LERRRTGRRDKGRVDFFARGKVKIGEKEGMKHARVLA